MVTKSAKGRMRLFYNAFQRSAASDTKKIKAEKETNQKMRKFIFAQSKLSFHFPCRAEIKRNKFRAAISQNADFISFFS